MMQMAPAAPRAPPISAAVGAFHRKSLQAALGRQTGKRHQHTNQKISDANAKQRAHGTAAEFDLAAMQTPDHTIPTTAPRLTQTESRAFVQPSSLSNRKLTM